MREGLSKHVKNRSNNEPNDSEFTIAGLMDTENCDRHALNDLSHIREATKEKINRTDKNRLERIVNCETNQQDDETITQRVVLKYRTWYTTELKKSLFPGKRGLTVMYLLQLFIKVWELDWQLL